MDIQGIVHPKMKIHHLLISCYSKPVIFFVLLKPKADILKKIGNQTVDGSTDFFQLFINCLITSILYNILFCVKQKK